MCQAMIIQGMAILKEVIAKHCVVLEPNKQKSEKIFPWVDKTIRNAKKVLLGIHHNCVNQQDVQNYLDEFCYKLNKLYFGDQLSDRFMITALYTTCY